MSEIKPVTWFDDPAHFRKPSRREFLYTGLIGGLGLTLGDFFKLQAAQTSTPGIIAPPQVAKSIIHIFMPGGWAAQETFDPKPYAPIEYRGPLGSIDTKLDGVRFSEHLKETAKIADKITVVRSMTHGEAAHERGTHNMFTGYRPSPALQFPSMGSVVSHELGSRNNLPPYVCVPNMPNEFAGSGYLSTAHGPFSLGGDPANNGFAVRDLNMHAGITPERFDRRRNILSTVDEHFRTLEKSDSLDAMDSFYQAAYSLVSSESAREAFNLAAELAPMREKYGHNEAGQRMLMARRLVEAGVRFVSMTYGGWDMHAKIQEGIARSLPPFDQAYAALIRDLDERGLLDSTIVMVTSEFGRTPKINKDAGRDHWPHAMSVLMAGAGIPGGQIVGATDAKGYHASENVYRPEDFAASLYTKMGIDPAQTLRSTTGKPVHLVNDGRLIKELFV